jgi:hypothetical protein
MTIISRLLCIAGGSLVLLSSSVGAQSYPPYPGAYPSYYPYNPYMVPYWQNGPRRWGRPGSNNDVPASRGWNASQEPHFWQPPDVPSMPPANYYGPRPRINPYTGGYGAGPWTVPQWNAPYPVFMPSYGSRPPSYSSSYRGSRYGFSPKQSQPSNVCH